MQKWIVGGAAAGGSVGLITSLINYLGSLKDDQEDAPNRLDDDTLYLNLRKKRNKMASIAGSGAIAGGAIAAMGSYALVRYLYQKMKKKELQEQLDNEQQGYLDLMDQPKAASENPLLNAARNLQAQQAQQAPAAPAAVGGERMKWPEATLSLPGALAVILGLSTAAVTNNVLKKTFPTPKAPGRRGPRRVVIRDLDKDASARDGIEETDGEEFMVRLLMAEKSASLSGFQDLVHAIGQGRHDEMATALVEFGLDTVHDMVKGASLTPLEEPGLSMAIGAAMQSPVLAPTMRLMAAAEFNEHFPTHLKWASVLSEEEQESLCKIAGIVATGMRIDAFAPHEEAMEKEGGMGGFMAFDALKDALVLNQLGKANKGHPHEDDSEDGDGDVVDKPQPESTDKTKIQSSDRLSSDFKKKHEDIIDSALQ